MITVRCDFSRPNRFNLTNELDSIHPVLASWSLGICNGFQAIVNLGLLPGFNGNYHERTDRSDPECSREFHHAWVRLKINPDSPCVFTRGIERSNCRSAMGMAISIRWTRDMESTFKNKQVVASIVCRFFSGSADGQLAG